MNHTKQKNIIKALTTEQLFERLKTDFSAIKDKLFCKVRTKKAIEYLIHQTIQELRNRNINFTTSIENPEKRKEFKNFDYSKRLVQLYQKIDGKITFTHILIY